MQSHATGISTATSNATESQPATWMPRALRYERTQSARHAPSHFTFPVIHGKYELR